MGTLKAIHSYRMDGWVDGLIAVQVDGWVGDWLGGWVIERRCCFAVSCKAVDGCPP